MSQPGGNATRDPFDRLAESFLERFRRGEHPSIHEYIQKHPEHSADIRELFPALIEVEQLKSVQERDPRLARLSSPSLARIGDYQILGVVGEGGMGIVYEAIRESLKSRVALKIMHPGFRENPRYLRRFHVEACAAASLHHTNIVSVFDYGEIDGVVYYAMPYVVGQSLERVLHDVKRMRTDKSAGRTTVSDAPSSSLADKTEDRYYREVARLGAQVADALAHAHNRGILHRDIKPSNLILDAIGNVWVTDFGLAKFEDGQNFSNSRDLIGTLRYMAPERFRGVSSRAGDIYALGATLYEMLALEPPFHAADQPALLSQITLGAPAPLRSRDPRIPRDLETIVLKALAKDPRDRFGTGEAMAEELRRYGEGRPILSRALPNHERLMRWCRRNPGLAALNALAASLTVTLAVAATLAAYTFRAQRNALESAQAKTRQSLDRAENAESDLRGQLERTREAEQIAKTERRHARIALGNSLLAEGAALQRGGLIGQRFGSLERLKQAARIFGDDTDGRDRIPEIRDQAIAASGLADLKITVRRPHPADSLTDCDHQFERYAYVDLSTREVVVRRIRDGMELLRLPSPTVPYWYAKANFSPDGRYLRARYAVQGEHGITEVWDLSRRECVVRVETRADVFLFLTDPSRFVYAPPKEGLAVWNLETREADGVVPLDSPEPNMAVYEAATGRVICNDGRERIIRLIDLASGHETARLAGPVGRNTMALSGDGRLLATGDWNGSVFVWDVKKQALASTLVGHTQFVGGCLFVPNSHLLVTSSWDGTLRIWDASLGQLLLTIKNASLLGVSPDGKALGLGLGELEFAVAQLAAPDGYRVLNPELVGNQSYEDSKHDMVRAAAFSPDGRILAIALQEGVHLYDAISGEHLGRLETGPCEEILFDHGGQFLISGGGWGYYRWPIRRKTGADALESSPRETWLLGPPELLTPVGLRTRMTKAAWLPDGKTLAVIDNIDAQVRLIDTSRNHPAAQAFESLYSACNYRMTTIAFSPDGRWAACGGWKEMGISLWELPTRKLVRLLGPCDKPEICRYFVAFTPDGKTLISSSHSSVAEYYAWDVETWTRRPLFADRGKAVERAPIFSPDGKVMAFWASEEQIRLVDLVGGQTLGNLANPLSLSSTPLAISADGSRLIVGTRTKVALLWDLDRVSGQLRELGLGERNGIDHGARQGSMGTIRVLPVGEVSEPEVRLTADQAAAEARLTVEPNDADALMSLGAVFVARGKDEEAIEVLSRRRAQTSGRESSDALLALVLNRRARDLFHTSTGPNANVDLRALTLARRAVSIAPEARDYLNTLGIALCRLGRDVEAIGCLEESLERGFGQTVAQDLYFLAIAHHRLGNEARARGLFDRAKAWHARRRFIYHAMNEELDRFRAEAEAALGLPVSPNAAGAGVTIRQ